jgi:hypothetical protein
MTEKDAWDFIRQVTRSRDPRIIEYRRMLDVKVEQYRNRRKGPL